MNQIEALLHAKPVIETLTWLVVGLLAVTALAHLVARALSINAIVSLGLARYTAVPKAGASIRPQRNSGVDTFAGMNALEVLVLAALSNGGLDEAGIIETLKKLSLGVCELSSGLQFTMSEMERKGLVIAECETVGPRADWGAPSKSYRPTRFGEQMLNETKRVLLAAA